MNLNQIEEITRTLEQAKKVRDLQNDYFKEGSSLKKKELLKKSKEQEKILDKRLNRALSIARYVRGELKEQNK